MKLIRLTLDERKNLDGVVPFYCKIGEGDDLSKNEPINSRDLYHKYQLQRFIDLYRGIRDVSGYEVSSCHIYMTELNYKLYTSRIIKLL